MDRRTRLSLCNLVSVQLNACYLCFSINRYSTASTSSAAYIIGGYTNAGLSKTIAEFKDNQWYQLGSMRKGRFLHGSIAGKFSNPDYHTYKIISSILYGPYNMDHIIWSMLYGSWFENNYQLEMTSWLLVDILLVVGTSLLLINYDA